VPRHRVFSVIESDIVTLSLLALERWS